MIRKYGGKELAKVLIYYGLIDDVNMSQFNINCPFHNDPNPSMQIKLDKGEFYCFGCGLSGDVLKFVQLANPELNDLQCCIILEQILNSNEIKALNVRYKTKKKKHVKQYLEEAKDYYYCLKTTDWHNITTREEQEVLEYMQGRGFDRRALNISKCKANYNASYPALFPILDNGEFKGWVGRTTDKKVEKMRKYLYNEGFRKRDTLCGNYRDGKVAYICEGYLDYLSLRTRGHIKDVVAILGWHISDEQVEKLKQKHITTVICALDNPAIDKAGEKGLNCLKKYFNVITFEYPDGVKDAGEMTEEQLRIAIKQTERKLKHGDTS